MSQVIEIELTLPKSMAYKYKSPLPPFFSHHISQKLSKLKLFSSVLMDLTKAELTVYKLNPFKTSPEYSPACVYGNCVI